MAKELIDSELLKLLQSIDTPTVCNAIEVAQGKRGFSQFTRGTMVCSAPQSGPLVGFAKTAKIAALSPPNEDIEIIKNRRMDYYRYMSEVSEPSIAVIEDEDFPDCIGAYWGEINTKVHKGFGLSGALTNGVVRDLGDLAEDFPVVAGSIGPSHGFVHVVEIGGPVSLMGMHISQDELMHADRHGAIVIPNEIIADLKQAIETVIANEAIVLGPARAPGFDIERLEKVWAEFEAART
jgi:regulator of RNase E activity RraA